VFIVQETGTSATAEQSEDIDNSSDDQVDIHCVSKKNKTPNSCP